MALLLGVDYALKKLEVALLGMHVHEVDVELLGEDFLDLLGLALAQKTMVHEDAGELLADGTSTQGCDHRGVNAARQAQDDAGIAYLLANLSNLLLHDVVHGPRGLKASNVEQEVGEQLLAMRGVTHLGMELRGVDALARTLHGGHGAHVGGSGDSEALGHNADGVAVAHPNALLLGSAVEQLRGALAVQVGMAVLAHLGVADSAAQRDSRDLMAIAETKNGNTELKDSRIDLGSILGIHAGGTT